MHGWFWREAALLTLAALFAAMALLWPVGAALAYTQEERQLMQAYQTGQIIRLHILANSDDPADQTLKIQVRDVVIEAFGERLAQAGETNADQTFELLVTQTEAIRQTAEEKARQLGFSGAVQAETGWLYLPEKQYESVCLPEGWYRGLRITLGEGQGRNWWCVLFPRLCLALSSDDAAGDEKELVWQTGRIFQHWLCMEE